MTIKMSRLHSRILLCVGILFLHSTAVAELEFKRCQIAVNAIELDAMCGRLQQPENPDSPDGKQIELFVAKIPSLSPNPEADAFTIIQGGPGGSSVDMAVNFYHVLAPILKKRDVLVVDQRGTGRSNALNCTPSDEALETLSFDPEIIARDTQDCLKELAETDPRFYTTSIAVQDLEAVRQAAGYEQLTLYGTSYGSRVAQHYLRRFPERARAVIIDGVVPVGLNLAGGEIARRSQQALDNLLARCTDTPACQEQFGDLKSKFHLLRNRLNDSPVPVTLPHPLTGRSTQQTVSAEHLHAVIRLMAYSTEGLALLPMVINEAEQGNYTPLLGQFLMINESFEQGFAMGMQNSVICAEDFPYVEPADTQNLDHTYFGTVMIDALKVSCTYWPRGPMDEDFHAPFNSDKPVLILSGETDPITPPANGEQALAMFSNAKHIVVPAHGHGVIGRGCLTPLVRDFVETPDFTLLNTQCAQREKPMPFFIDTTGPTP